jgi:hypothetical protein
LGYPVKKLLTDVLDVILIDVTESPVERPEHSQRKWYSGKKKRHAIKTQIIIGAKTHMVIAIFVAHGKTHDFKMFKNSVGVRVVAHIKIIADSGYQGIIVTELEIIQKAHRLTKKKTEGFCAAVV